MSFLAKFFGLETRADDVTAPVHHVYPPVDARRVTEPMSEALGLIPVYRALQLLTTAAGQLPIEQVRGDRVITGKAQSPVVSRPDPTSDRTSWIEQAVMSLATDGNLFLKGTAGPNGQWLSVEVLPPREVIVYRDPKTDRVEYHYKGVKLAASEVQHRKFMATPDSLRGLGPIQAARNEITGAVDVRDYATGWFNSSGQPAGLITGKSIDTQEKATATKEYWNRAAADLNNPTNVRVLSGEISYTPLLLNPKDAQWLEVRKFSVTDIARLFGIPSALMLVSLDGNSLTYSNVEQEWLAFTRFTLMGYLRKIEEALSYFTPIGSKARFNLEGLLRSDTKSRYETYAAGIAAGFLTPDEARAKENLEPLTDAQIDQIKQVQAKQVQA